MAWCLVTWQLVKGHSGKTEEWLAECLIGGHTWSAQVEHGRADNSFAPGWQIDGSFGADRGHAWMQREILWRSLAVWLKLIGGRFSSGSTVGLRRCCHSQSYTLGAAAAPRLAWKALRTHACFRLAVARNIHCLCAGLCRALVSAARHLSTMRSNTSHWSQVVRSTGLIYPLQHFTLEPKLYAALVGGQKVALGTLRCNRLDAHALESTCSVACTHCLV